MVPSYDTCHVIYASVAIAGSRDYVGCTSDSAWTREQHRKADVEHPLARRAGRVGQTQDDRTPQR